MEEQRAVPARKREIFIARTATLVVFAALIRTVLQLVRVHLDARAVHLYSLGALLSSVACLLMALGEYMSQHRIVMVIAILAIAALVLVKCQLGR